MGAVAISLLAAIAGAALLLPPPAEAGSSGALAPAARSAVGTSRVAADAASPTAGWVARALGRVAALGRVDRPARPPRASRGRAAAACGKRGMRGVVNLNQASERELDLLPGVGPAKAKRIAAWRAAHGPFKRLRDLRRVKGFGKKTVRKLTPYLTLNGPTTAVAPE